MNRRIPKQAVVFPYSPNSHPTLFQPSYPTHFSLSHHLLTNSLNSFLNTLPFLPYSLSHPTLSSNTLTSHFSHSIFSSHWLLQSILLPHALTTLWLPTQSLSYPNISPNSLIHLHTQLSLTPQHLTRSHYSFSHPSRLLSLLWGGNVVRKLARGVGQEGE